MGYDCGTLFFSEVINEMRSWMAYVVRAAMFLLFWKASTHIMMAVLSPPPKGVTFDWTNPGNGWVLGLSLAFGVLGGWIGRMIFDKAWRYDKSKNSN